MLDFLNQKFFASKILRYRLVICSCSCNSQDQITSPLLSLFSLMTSQVQKKTMKAVDNGSRLGAGFWNWTGIGSGTVVSYWFWVKYICASSFVRNRLVFNAVP